MKILDVPVSKKNVFLNWQKEHLQQCDVDNRNFEGHIFNSEYIELLHMIDAFGK